MRAFALTSDQALLFFELCHELGAETEEARTAILDALADVGQVKSITSTPMTKEQYTTHLAKHFKVGVIKSNGSIGSVPKTDDQPKGK
jgi:hypothetical protein